MNDKETGHRSLGIFDNLLSFISAMKKIAFIMLNPPTLR
jgi:hypothetical protein